MDAFVEFVADTWPDGGGPLLDMGARDGQLSVSAAERLSVAVLAVDARQEAVKAARANRRDVTAFQVECGTFDVLAGLLVGHAITGILACGTLGPVLSDRATTRHPPHRAAYLVRWWTQTVRDAGVRYLWTCSGKPGWTLSAVEDQVPVLEQCGWKADTVREGQAFLRVA
jgi:hypothetical protein